jgi:hypothetical protein
VKIVMFWIAATGVLLLERFGRTQAHEGDDGVAFFVGSARPLPANALQQKKLSHPAAPRSGLR